MSDYAEIKYAVTEADLKLFTALWNQRMRLTTPNIHFRMADWLEHAWKTGDTNLLLTAFRSSGKSTMVGLFAAWLLYRHPALRILVLAADHALAKKMVRNVKRIIERHPLTAHLKPDKADQWAGERFTVNREIELRDPSMMAKGVTSNITGSRADIIICDDVEVPNTCDSAEKREDLRERLSENSFVLVPGGTQLYVGTPHTYFSIYADRPRTEEGEDEIFLKGFKRLSIPVLNKEGESAWPERFGEDDIVRMKRRSGPNKFNSQMMLKAVNIADGRLDPDLLQYYDAEIDYAPELSTLYLGHIKLTAASAWWDPAFGSASGDRSVFAVVYADDYGGLYLHHVEYINILCRKKDVEREVRVQQTDEATQQCRIVAALAKRFRLPSVCVEINGIGKFLPAILRNELAKAKAPCTVREISSRRPKDVRILEAFDAILAAQRLYVNKGVTRTPFMSEMREWRPGISRGHDDGLDAVAGALSQHPVRIKRLYSGGNHRWQRGQKSHTADSDFEV